MATDYSPAEIAERLMPNERALLLGSGDRYGLEGRDSAREYFRRSGIIDEFGLFTEFGKAVRAAADKSA